MADTRHPLTGEPLTVTGPAKALVESAEALETAGNWFLAGEKYGEAAGLLTGTDAENRARLLARAAACFDIANQRRAAAHAYNQAASELQNQGVRFQTAGELYNRAALFFREVDEYFTAGSRWNAAASCFEQATHSRTFDNIPPVPSAAGHLTVAACCYTAAADVFLPAGDEAVWSCGSYWQAGRAHEAQGVGYHAFVAYRKALAAAARFYGTHDREKLRTVLPLTEEERAAKIDPLRVMERQARNGNQTHQSRNAAILSSGWVDAETARQLEAAYHEFYLTFEKRGSVREAEICRVKEKEYTRQSLMAGHHYRKALGYSIWKATSKYGESLARWATVCGIVLLAFTFFYAIPGLIKPVHSWFDYFYFSVVTFTSLGACDIYPVGIAGKAAVCAEILCGLVMFGLLLTFIGNRIRR